MAFCMLHITAKRESNGKVNLGIWGQIFIFDTLGHRQESPNKTHNSEQKERRFVGIK